MQDRIREMSYICHTLLQILPVTFSAFLTKTISVPVLTLLCTVSYLNIAAKINTEALVGIYIT